MFGRDKRFIAFVLYPGVSPLDLVGPLTVLRDLRIGSPYHTVVVGERADPLKTDSPLRVVPAATVRAVPDPVAHRNPGHDGSIPRVLEAAGAHAMTTFDWRLPALLGGLGLYVAVQLVTLMLVADWVGFRIYR